MRRIRPRISLVVTLIMVVANPSAANAGPASSHSLPAECENERSAIYRSHECKVHRLRQRSFVVIAVPDTGINPYHLDFRLPSNEDLLGVHPSEFIDSFPASAPVLDLELDADSYSDAVARDQDIWDSIEDRKLYSFSGTNIIGGISFGSGEDSSGTILDGSGHGTAVASLAAGRIHGIHPGSDVLLVSVQAPLDSEDPFIWAFDQPWIDVVSVSAKCPAPTLCPMTRSSSKSFVARGGIAVFGSGNGWSGMGLPCEGPLDPTIVNDTAGPPWHFVVGAASGRSGQPTCWHSVPPDVVAAGDFLYAAAADSMRSQTRVGPGTSFATPIVAGAVARVIVEARRTVGDASEGAQRGLLASGTQAAGLLEDGDLSGEEAEEVISKTAQVESFSPVHASWYPWVIPNTPAYFVFAGYGLVDKDSLEAALDVMHGREPMPDRSDVDTWMELRDSLADRIWNTVP